MKKMKKLSVAIALCIITRGMIFAQTDGEKYAAFQFTFVPPLSTNGLYAPLYTNGASVNALLGVSRNETGFALGGIANVITHNANGLQIAGLCNYVGNDGKGLLISGLFNTVRNSYKGGQLAGLLNSSGDVAGVQIAGLVNVAQHVSGVQIAGIVNIAEDSDYPIGLVNLIKSGTKGITVTYNETGSTVVSFRSGGKITYGIVGIGYNHKADGNAFVFESGIGATIHCTSWFGINHEIKNESIGNLFKEKDATWKLGYSLLPTFRIASHFEIFGGPGINYLHTQNMAAIELFPSHSLWEKQGSSKLQQVYVGYQIGMQYVF
jgi:hypothetical protein